jgi:hypothetical protein
LPQILTTFRRPFDPKLSQLSLFILTLILTPFPKFSDSKILTPSIARRDPNFRALTYFARFPFWSARIVFRASASTSTPRRHLRHPGLRRNYDTIVAILASCVLRHSLTVHLGITCSPPCSPSSFCDLSYRALLIMCCETLHVAPIVFLALRPHQKNCRDSKAYHSSCPKIQSH